jgi:hypothetical protein
MILKLDLEIMNLIDFLILILIQITLWSCLKARTDAKLIRHLQLNVFLVVASREL